MKQVRYKKRCTFNNHQAGISTPISSLHARGLQGLPSKRANREKHQPAGPGKRTAGPVESSPAKCSTPRRVRHADLSRSGSTPSTDHVGNLLCIHIQVWQMSGARNWVSSAPTSKKENATSHTAWNDAHLCPPRPSDRQVTRIFGVHVALFHRASGYDYKHPQRHGSAKHWT